MTQCRDVEAHLSEWVDGTLPPSDTARIVEHIDTCDACARLARDLGALKAAARSLGPVVPPARVYAALAARLPIAASASEPAAIAPAQNDFSWLGVAAAVAIVLGGVAGIVHLDRAAQPLRPAGNAAAALPVEGVTDEWRGTLTEYERTIAVLETAARAPRAGESLDPAVATTLANTLATVNSAIAESRAAVEAEPDSDVARDSLSDSLRRKVTVLEATVAALNDGPKGD